jgi:hypothetical protein
MQQAVEAHRVVDVEARRWPYAPAALFPQEDSWYSNVFPHTRFCWYSRPLSLVHVEIRCHWGIRSSFIRQYQGTQSITWRDVSSCAQIRKAKFNYGFPRSSPVGLTCHLLATCPVLLERRCEFISRWQCYRGRNSSCFCRLRRTTSMNGWLMHDKLSAIVSRFVAYCETVVTNIASNPCSEVTISCLSRGISHNNWILSRYSSVIQDNRFFLHLHHS